MEVARRRAAQCSRSSARPGTARAARRDRRPRRRRCRPPRRFRGAPRSSIVSPGSRNPARHEYIAFGKARLAPEQAIVAIDRQHDDDRIGAREMLRPCTTSHSRRQPAAATRVDRAAIGAIAMARMPMHQRLGLPEDADEFGRRAGPGVAIERMSTSASRRDPARPARAGRGSRRWRRRATRPRRRPATPRRSGAPPGNRPSRATTAARRAPRSRRGETADRGRPRPSSDIGVSRQMISARASGRARSAARNGSSSRRSDSRSSGLAAKANAIARSVDLKKASFMLSTLPSTAARRRAATPAALAKPTISGLNRRESRIGLQSARKPHDGANHKALGAERRRRRPPAAAGLACRLRPRRRRNRDRTAFRRSAISPCPPISNIFDYVNPDAPKGGLLSLQITTTGGNQNFDTFDTLNMFSKKGDGAAGMSATFDNLMSGTGDEPDSVYGLVARGGSLSPPTS